MQGLASAFKLDAAMLISNAVLGKPQRKDLSVVSLLSKYDK